MIYLTAVHTGLRRKELKSGNGRPAFGREAAFRAASLARQGLRQRAAEMETFKRDLRRAGIEFIDAKGRRADFHSLRHTLGTNLALAGTAPRVAMEAMRHSDIRLTTKTYTDTGLLPVSDAVAKLPSFLGPPAKDSQIDSQTLFREGQALSIPVINSTNGSKRKVYENHELTGVVSGPVTTGQDSEKSCAIQVRTLGPSAIVGLLWSVAGTPVAFGYSAALFLAGSVLVARLRVGGDFLSP